MVVIAVGTLNKYKLLAVRDALGSIPQFEGVSPSSIRTTFNDVVSGVSHQPKTSLEALQGSFMRARNAAYQTNDVDYAVGVEGGIELVGGLWFDFAWVCVIDLRAKTLNFARSCGVVVPQQMLRQMSRGKDLSEAVELVVGIDDARLSGGLHSIVSAGTTDISREITQTTIVAFAGLTVVATSYDDYVRKNPSW